MRKGRGKKEEQRGRKRLEIRELNFYYKVPSELLGVLDFSYLCDRIQIKDFFCLIVEKSRQNLHDQSGDKAGAGARGSYDLPDLPLAIHRCHLVPKVPQPPKAASLAKDQVLGEISL